MVCGKYRFNRRKICGIYELNNRKADMTWIHQQPDWPNFYWDHDALAVLLGDIRYRQGLLSGRTEKMRHDLQDEAVLETVTDDAVSTSHIEGELLSREDVRSSIARRLGITQSFAKSRSRDIDGIVQVQLDATKNFASPVTQERLFGWQGALFPAGRRLSMVNTGDWRLPGSEPMQVVSGSYGREKVHFEAIQASLVPRNMARLLDWIEHPLKQDPVIRSGVAHLWFLSIHPFDDGNGRLTRALSDLMLCRAESTSRRLYSVSTEIDNRRKHYYEALEQQQRSSLDVTSWLKFYLECVHGALLNADKTLGHIFSRALFWDKATVHGLNDRQKSVLSRFLEPDFQGYLNTSKYAVLAKCSPDTALRDIKDLVSDGLLIQNEAGGRSTSYRTTLETTLAKHQDTGPNPKL